MQTDGNSRLRMALVFILLFCRHFFSIAFRCLQRRRWRTRRVSRQWRHLGKLQNWRRSSNSIGTIFWITVTNTNWVFVLMEEVTKLNEMYRVTKNRNIYTYNIFNKMLSRRCSIHSNIAHFAARTFSTVDYLWTLQKIHKHWQSTGFFLQMPSTCVGYYYSSSLVQIFAGIFLC